MKELNKSHINIFYLITILFWASLYTYQPIMSPYLNSININYSMIGIIGGSYGLTQMVLRIPLGILSDRLRMRKIFICCGTIISVLSSLILYFTKNPFLILIGRGMSGMAASVWVIFTVLYSSYFIKNKTASSISFLTMCNNTGQVAGMLAGSIFAGYLGYKFPFLLGAVIGTLGFILSFFIKENVPLQDNPPKLKELISVIKNKNLIIMSSLAILSQMVLFGAMNTFTPMVAVSLNASSSELGFLSVLSSIPRILSAMLCGILFARKINVKKLLSFSFVLLMIGCVAIPFCPNLFVLYPVSILAGFGSGISMTVLISLCIRDIEHNRRSAAMGFFQAIYGIGMFIGPVLVGLFAEGLGLKWGFIFSAFVAFIGVIGCIVFVENE